MSTNTETTVLLNCAKCGTLLDSIMIPDNSLPKRPDFPHLCGKCKDNFDKFLRYLFLKSDIEQKD